MNWIDIGIVASLLYHTGAGFRNGTRKGALDLAALALALVLTVTQFTHVSDLVREFTSIPAGVANWASFLFCFGITSAVLGGSVQLYLRFNEPGSITWFSHLAGSLLASFKGLLLISFLLAVFSLMPVSESVRNRLDQSPLAPTVLSVFPLFFDTVVGEIQPESSPVMNHLDKVLNPQRSVEGQAPADGDNSFIRMLRRLIQQNR